jgi:hypothetical protein
MIDQNGAWSRGRLHAGQTTFSTVAQMVIYKGGGGSSNAPPAQSFAIAGAWSNNQTVFFTILYDTAEA